MTPDETPRRRTVRSDDGLDLAVRDFGDPAAPRVVLVHGYPDTGSVWDRVAQQLAARFHVIVPDVRGTGESAAPPDRAGYRLDRLAADIRAIADATSPDAAVHVVGHDWGSVQAWEAVTGGELEGRIASFTSLSGPSLDHLGHWMRHGPKQDRLRQLPKSWYVAAFHLPGAGAAWRRVVANRWPDVLARMEGIDRATIPDTPTLARDAVNGLELYRANVRPRMRNPRPRTTDVPVQLVVAEHDRFVSPAMADAALPHCTRLVRRVEPFGHWSLLLAHPERLADLIGGFVDEVVDQSR